MATVTVYTDASFCPETGAGGWAAWIRVGDRRQVVGDAFRSEIQGGSAAAEMAAAANGIAAAVKLDMARPGDLVVVVSDSETVVDRLVGHPDAPRHPGYGRMVAAARALASKHGLRIKVNKVKAHSRADGARSQVNRLVDEESRQHMRAARARAVSGPPARTLPIPDPQRTGGTALIRILEQHGSIAVAAALWKAGAMTRRAVREVVAAVAASERSRSPRDWAESCARTGLIHYSLPITHPEEAIHQASQVSVDEFATLALRPRVGPSDLMRALSAGEFPHHPPALAGADGLVVAAFARAGQPDLELLRGHLGREIAPAFGTGAMGRDARPDDEELDHHAERMAPR